MKTYRKFVVIDTNMNNQKRYKVVDKKQNKGTKIESYTNSNRVESEIKLHLI
jgi:hypothetical protein